MRFPGHRTELRIPDPVGRQDHGPFRVHAVAAPRLAAGLLKSPVELWRLFDHSDSVLVARLAGHDWYFGRTPEWTMAVAGSRSLWADIDVLPLGLGRDPTYYAMGGLPGAPPSRQRQARQLAVRGGVNERAVDDNVADRFLDRALDTALDPGTGRLDLRMFARLFFLSVTTSALCGFDPTDAELARVLGWFDRWSEIIESPLIALRSRRLPGSPARRLRPVLDEWWAYLAGILDSPASQSGVVAVLRAAVDDGRVAYEEAVGYLATIVFAGTEPPSQTLLWAFTHASTAPHHDLRGIDETEAEGLLWESLRVQPSTNFLVRRIASVDEDYRSASDDVFVVAPPLTHQHSNTVRGLPHNFTPSLAGKTELDPNGYPGLGAGAHHCIGARLGMRLARRVLARLLSDADVDHPGHTTPVGRVMARPRRLPVVSLR